MEWVLTYAVHSTALIAAIWLLTSVIPRLSLGTREALWKVALLGPLATATVVTASGVPSVWGTLPVPSALRTEPVEAAPVATATATGAVSEAPVVERRIVHHRTGELEITAIRQRDGAPAALAPAAAAPAPTESSPWPLVLLGLWGVGALAALGRLGWAAARLRKQLKGRRDVVEDPVLESFLELCSKAGFDKKRPRLTASPHLRSPIALGRREICLPERAVDSLSPQQQQGMLAHEMAHLVRHDPVWSVAVAVIEAVFFFQPLNHLARRKIQEVAEYQCDDWAAQQTGTGVHLAKCLAEVAGWVEDGPPVSPAVVAMADKGSPIVRRITRLLHQRRSGGRVHPVGRVALTVGTLGVVIAVVPRMSQARTDDEATTSSRPSAVALASVERPHGVVFEDRSDGDHDRSRLRLRAGDEVVEIEVQARRPAPPPPPPAPPAPRDEGDRIVIMGQFGGGLPWCCGGLFGGWLGLGDIGVIIESSSPFGWPGYDHGAQARARAFERAERAQERAERALERAERRRERALGRLEREIERRAEHDSEWPSIFGVSLERSNDEGERAVIEL